MRSRLLAAPALLLALTWVGCSGGGEETNPPSGRLQQAAWTPLKLADDPLIRMPGTQPGSTTLEDPKNCTNCHAGYNTQVEPGFNWQGSMMAQAARDFLFFASLTVAGQDSIWALGTPNAVDLCERCHFPKGWIEGRSDPPNASKMIGADWDGVQCGFCHRMYDPHFEETHAGTREGSDWAGYWDESNASSTKSSAAAATTRTQDIVDKADVKLFSGNDFFSGNKPFSAAYTEAGGGQFFISKDAAKRSSFADAGAKHNILYSRFNKSRYFCSSCHDVSNPALQNLSYKAVKPGDGTTVLPSESSAANSYYHLERTFSEFMLSAYGQQGGAAGIGPFAPTAFSTSKPGNKIASCQDCHMRDVSGVGCNKSSGINRPAGSTEHPKSGQPLHDLTGGNIWVSYVLASATAGAANYNATNAALLNQGAAKLTLDLTAGLQIDPKALLSGVNRAKQQLQLAASITNLSYNASTGALSFRVQNQTGHKLISGYPEGRRVFVNVRTSKGGALIHEVNPYSSAAGTLKGLPASYSPQSPALASGEVHRDDLVYETKLTSSLTSEQKTFHMVLATGRYKDNRIPPMGFQIAKAAARQAQPYKSGSAANGLYTSAEYAGGYDQVDLTVATGGDKVEVRLYYQVTSREFIEFLRDEIKGTKQTLPAGAYIVQTDPFFAGLKAWGDTIWQLWSNNKNVPGAAPFLMTQASTTGSGGGCSPPATSVTSVAADSKQVTVTWSDEHSSDASVVGYRLYYDQAGKSQLVATLGKVTSYVDTGLTNGQTYCYKVAVRYAACEGAASPVKCATPKGKTGALCSAAAQCISGYCVDGVCCTSACGGGASGDCQACSVSAGATKDGTCGPVASGTLCRPVAGVCDLAESCNGSSTACPTNSFKPTTSVCRTANGVCDAVESCSGSSAACPADKAKPAGSICRTSAGVCDVVEVCNGSAKTCPTDTFKPSTSICRAPSGVCDAAEKCSGTAAACPADGVVKAGVTCRAALGPCDVPEACTGASKSCPTNGYKASSTVCRGAKGGCDAVEKCTGAAAACPVDQLKVGDICRPTKGECDFVETCSGTSLHCPTDAYKANGTSCSSGTGSCTKGYCLVGDASVPDLGPDQGPDLGPDQGSDAASDGPDQDFFTADSLPEGGSEASVQDGLVTVKDVGYEAIADDLPHQGDTTPPADDDGGCNCRVTGRGSSGLPSGLLLLCLLLIRRRRTE